MSVPQCTSIPENICETLQEETPFVTTRKACRKEEKKICDLVQTTQPKQVILINLLPKICRC